MPKAKNKLDGCNNRMVTAEERINEIKDRL